jgi:hypothetical protein
LERAADPDPPAAAFEPLAALAEVEVVLELEPHAARTTAVTTTVPVSIASRTVRR